MIGQPVDDALGIERHDRIRSTVAGLATGEVPMQRAEVDTTDWAGTKRTLAVSASLTNAWDEPSHVVLVAENLTADRRRQHQEGRLTDRGRPAGVGGRADRPPQPRHLRGTARGIAAAGPPARWRRSR